MLPGGDQPVDPSEKIVFFMDYGLNLTSPKAAGVMPYTGSGTISLIPPWLFCLYFLVIN